MRFLPVSENECERIAFILKLQPMFIVNSYALAVLFCFITMMCWGSWGNTQKLASKSWRYELFYWGLRHRYVGALYARRGVHHGQHRLRRAFVPCPIWREGRARGVGSVMLAWRDFQRLEHPALGFGGHGGAVGRLSAGCRTGTGGRRRQLRGCAQRRSRHPVSGRGAGSLRRSSATASPRSGCNGGTQRAQFRQGRRAGRSWPAC